MHKFSIIIPLYNKALYVKKAIESVFSQTYKDWELIVIDDGSTDNSYSEAENTLNGVNTSIYKLIRQANSGVGATRNKGVKLSKNDYLCFLDADDWWESTFLEEMDKLIANYTDAGIYGADYYYVKNNKKKYNFKSDTGYINFCKIYSEYNSIPFNTDTVCIKKCVFNEFGGFPEQIKLGEDFCLWIRVALNYKVAYLNKPLSNYNQDVDVTYRLTRHLHKPEHHMLFNLSELEPYEQINADYKKLIDKLRVSGLLEYWMSVDYHDRAEVELKKVDWSNIEESYSKLYKIPICVLKIRTIFYQTGSFIKQKIIKIFIK